MPLLTSNTPDSAASGEGQRQRRTSRRHPFHAEVEVLDPSVGNGVTLNASEGGLRVAVDNPLLPDQECLIILREPNNPDRMERVRVAWSREVRDGWIAGLQYIGLH